MQVDGVLSEYPRVLENDWADRRLAAPVGEVLILLAGRAESVEGRGPARVGLRPAVQWGKGPDPAALIVSGLGERFGAEQLEGAGERVAEWRRLEASPDSGVLEQVLAPRDLCLQVFLALARGLELLLGDALRFRVEVRLPDLAGQALGIAVADALTEPTLDIVVDDLREAAKLLLDGLRLLDE